MAEFESSHARAGQCLAEPGASHEPSFAASFDAAHARSASTRGQANDIRAALAADRKATAAEEKPCHKIGLVAHDGKQPLRLRSSPDTAAANVVAELAFNTRVQVVAEVRGGWYRIAAPGGVNGYLAAIYVRTNLPEPTAKLHRVEAGAGGTAIGIAEQHFKDKARDWGQDLRFYVNVIARLNGVAVPETVDGWKHVHFKAGQMVWVPGAEFARGLVGVVNSGSRSYEAADAMGVAQGMERVGQVLEDIKAAVALSVDYLGEAIAHHVTESLVGVLTGLALALAGAGLLLLITTAIGAGLGALAGGAGAAPGAALGFQAGLAIVEWLGLALLLMWAASAGVRIGAAFGRFLGLVLSAGGDAAQIDEAARALADAIGTSLGVMLEAAVLLATMWGVPRVVGALKGTRFGEAIGEQPLGRWLSERVANHRAGEGPLRGPNHPRQQGRPDAAHEAAQANRWVRSEHGGGQIEWLGRHHQGIEGFWTPRGGGEKIPFSLKDFSKKGRMSNMIKPLNENAGHIIGAGYRNAVLHVRVTQWKIAAVRAFVEAGPIGRMPGEGAFARIVFECADGVFAIGAPSPVPFPLPSAPIGPMPHERGSHQEREAP
ncbi:MAG: SH3 domain-containing protein [bacterium]